MADSEERKKEEEKKKRKKKEVLKRVFADGGFRLS